MKNRIIVVGLALVMLLGACALAHAQAVVPECFQKVVYEQGSFHHIPAKKDMTLDEVSDLFDGASVAFPEYALVDLDKDGADEMVLVQAVNGDDYYGFLVLDASGDKVFGYEFVYRAMLDLRTDGTFSFSSGAENHGYGHVMLDGTADILPIAECVNDGETIEYFKEDVKITEDEFQKLMDEQLVKPLVDWNKLDAAAKS